MSAREPNAVGGRRAVGLGQGEGEQTDRVPGLDVGGAGGSLDRRYVRIRPCATQMERRGTHKARRTGRSGGPSEIGPRLLEGRPLVQRWLGRVAGGPLPLLVLVELLPLRPLPRLELPHPLLHVVLPPRWAAERCCCGNCPPPPLSSLTGRLAAQTQNGPCNCRPRLPPGLQPCQVWCRALPNWQQTMELFYQLGGGGGSLPFLQKQVHRFEKKQPRGVSAGD